MALSLSLVAGDGARDPIVNDFITLDHFEQMGSIFLIFIVFFFPPRGLVFQVVVGISRIPGAAKTLAFAHSSLATNSIRLLLIKVSHPRIFII